MFFQTSSAGLALIKKWEGCYSYAYHCPAGVLTIGYGHTNLANQPPRVVEGMTITRDQAHEILVSDLRLHERRVNQLVEVDLTQAQFDVLVSFDFNTGALEKSTLLRKLNAGDYDAVPRELMRWTKGGGRTLQGLVNRRGDEARMWCSHEDAPPLAAVSSEDIPSPVGAMAQEVDAPQPEKPLSESKTIWASLLQGGAGLTTLGLFTEKAVNGMTPTVALILGLAALSTILAILIAKWRRDHSLENLI